MICAFLISLLQDSADDWIDRLRVGESAGREAAMRWLGRNGDPILARIRALATDSDPEVAVRAAEIVRRIEWRRRFKPFPAVTLRADDAPLPEVLRRIRDETGWAFALEDVPVASLVDVDFDALPVLEALGVVCRQGNLTVDRDPHDRIVIRPGNPDRQFVAPDGQVMVMAEGWEQVWNLMDGLTEPRYVWLTLSVLWTHHRAPSGVRIIFHEATTESGVNLNPEPARRPSEPHSPYVWHDTIDLRHPPEGTTSIRITGEVEFLYAEEVDQRVLSWKQIRAGYSTVVGGIAVSVSAEDDHTVRYHLRRIEVALDGVELRAQGVTTQGEEVSVGGISLGMGRTSSGTWGFGSREPGWIVLSVPTRVESVRVPFLFNDLPIQ